MLSNSSLEFSYPQLSLSAVSPSEFGRSRFGVFAAHANNVHLPHGTPTSDGQRSAFPLSGFPLSGKSATAMSKSLAFQFAEPRLPIHCHVGSAMSPGPTRPRHFRGFAFRESKSPKFLLVATPNAGTRCSGFVPPVHARIDGLDQIGRSQLAISMCMKSLLSLAPDLPICDGQGSFAA
jgi:hypothetical protein